MDTNPQLWRTLKVGDRVRLVRIPTEFLDWTALLPETKRAYRYLARRRRPLVVWMIDEYGFPWVAFRMRGRSGRTEHHAMAFNHGGLALVKPRRPAKKPVKSGRRSGQ